MRDPITKKEDAKIINKKIKSASTIQEKQFYEIKKNINKRMNDVLGPCILEFEKRFITIKSPIEILHNLTEPLLLARLPTKKIIEDKMRLRYSKDPDKIPSAVSNSLKRSAGTNYQTLVTYALAKYFFDAESFWYAQHPVPKEFKNELAISFTAGIGDEYLPKDDDLSPLEEEENSEEDVVSENYKVQPDIDILLRHSDWDNQRIPTNREPIILLSVKTSLADRAGMAARWKTYFDQVSNPCVFSGKPGCVYDKLGITMENSVNYIIYHIIVTANIYKIDGRDILARKGELNSGQTRSNTHMFDLKLTTRDDGIAFTPNDWQQMPYIVEFLKNISKKNGLKMFR